MRKWIPCIVCLVWVAASTAAFAKAEVETVASGVQSLYRGISTLSFDFVQETKLELLDKKVEKRGQMHFKRPGKFVIHYATPPLKDYLSNGSRLWIILPAEGKVYEESLKKGELDEQAKLFLDGLGDLQESFVVSPLPERQMQAAMFSPGADRAYLQLISKKDSAFFAWIALGVDPVSYRVVEMTLFNRSQNVSHYVFSNFKVNMPLADEMFVFKKNSINQKP